MLKHRIYHIKHDKQDGEILKPQKMRKMSKKTNKFVETIEIIETFKAVEQKFRMRYVNSKKDVVVYYTHELSREVFEYGSNQWIYKNGKLYLTRLDGDKLGLLYDSRAHFFDLLPNSFPLHWTLLRSNVCFKYCNKTQRFMMGDLCLSINPMTKMTKLVPINDMDDFQRFEIVV